MVRQKTNNKANPKADKLKTDNSKLRAVGYSRTSGKDDTSLGNQQEAIEKFIDFNKMQFVCHYKDEHLSGAKVEGRDDFQRMMKDATNDKFDIIVVYDVTRFARDGCDIISNATFLKEKYDIHVVDVKGAFNMQKSGNVVLNYTLAGFAEYERLKIMGCCIGGRIKKAKEGLLWCAHPPAGRGFTSTGEHTGDWFITDEGHKLQALLKRYADGEPLKALAKEYGFLCEAVILRNIHQSQLSGVYEAVFNAPEIGIENLLISVPQVPPIISAELERRVRERLTHNRRCNKQHYRKYILSGFLKCSHCNRALVGQENGSHIYYRHYADYATTGQNCPYRSIRADLLEAQVLDYLYSFFLDEPAYSEAVKRDLPSVDDRKALEQDIEKADRALAKVNYGISNLLNAITRGLDAGWSLDKQTELKAEKLACEKRLNELQQTLMALPNPEIIQEQAMRLRLQLVQEHKGKDWRAMPYEDIRRFLHFLFGDNPMRSGHGIFVGSIDGKWHITFKGSVQFYHDVVAGRPIDHAFSREGARLNAQIRGVYEQGIAEVDGKYREALKDAGVIKPHKDSAVKPSNDNE